MDCSLILLGFGCRATLAASLASIARQRRLPGEVVVAGEHPDGAIAAILRDAAPGFPVPLRHVFDADDLSRSADLYNHGIAASRGGYVACIDGDVLLHPAFIADHLALSEPGTFLLGHCSLVTPEYSAHVLAGARPSFSPRTPIRITATHGEKRRHLVHMRWLARRKLHAADSGLIFSNSCMGFWREDLLRVNGYNAEMRGPGREDLELDVRLRNAGVRRCRLRYAGLALRLDNPERTPVHPDDAMVDSNRVLRATALRRLRRCDVGVHRLLAAYPLPPPDLRSIASEQRQQDAVHPFVEAAVVVQEPPARTGADPVQRIVG